MPDIMKPSVLSMCMIGQPLCRMLRPARKAFVLPGLLSFWLAERPVWPKERPDTFRQIPNLLTRDPTRNWFSGLHAGGRGS